MKLNLKKLGVAVIGAAVLASSVAFAGLYYQNTQLVTSNGDVTAKVVVGEHAAVTDAVAAAEIASVLAANAYKDVQLTAQVQGEATCGTSGESSAECTVTDKTVTLDVTVPGLESTAMHQFNLLIAEDADNDIGDRALDYSDDKTDLLDEEADFWSDQDDHNLADNPYGESDLSYMIDGSKFSPFDDFSVKTASSAQIGTEYQRIYVVGGTNYDNTENTVYFGQNNQSDLGVVYALLFGPSDEGISLCPGDDGTALADCADSDSLSGKRYQVEFLGEPWVISGVEYTKDSKVTSQSSNHKYESDEDVAMPGEGDFTLKLAKESRYGILNVGDCLETDQVKVCLDDISRETGAENEHPAIVSLYDKDGNLVTQDQVNPGETDEMDVGNGNTVKVHVYQTAPGYTLGAKWAEMAILEHEIELKHGKKFLEDKSDTDSDWTVYFGLVNKNAPTDNIEDVVANATNLKEVLFVADEDAFSAVNDDVDGLEKGDSLPILDLDGYQAFELQNLGLTDADMDSLDWRFIDTLSNPKTFKLYDSSEHNVRNLTNVKQYVRIRSALDEAFKPTTTITKKASEIYVVWNDTINNNATDTGEFYVLMKRSDGDYYQIATTADAEFEYKNAGSNPSGKIKFELNSSDTVKVSLIENVGPVAAGGDGEDTLSTLAFFNKDHYGFYADGSSHSVDDKITYETPASYEGYGYVNDHKYDEGFISMRGTEVQSISDDELKFKVPNKVREVQMLLKPTETSGSSVNTQTVGPLREGDTATVGDVTIKVDSIDVETTATCTAGSSGGATADMSNVKAVISDGSQTYETYDAAKPLDSDSVKQLAKSLVKLDSQVSDVDTLITVGGPAVNSVTDSALQGSDATLSPDSPVLVKAVGNKIVVAGWTAADTQTAAEQFIDALTRQ